MFNPYNQAKLYTAYVFSIYTDTYILCFTAPTVLTSTMYINIRDCTMYKLFTNHYRQGLACSSQLYKCTAC